MRLTPLGGCFWARHLSEQYYQPVISVQTLTCPSSRASFYWTHPSASLEASMWKALLAGTTALAIAGSSVAFAQQPPPQQAPPAPPTPPTPPAGAQGRPHPRPRGQGGQTVPRPPHPPLQ